MICHIGWKADMPHRVKELKNKLVKNRLFSKFMGEDWLSVRTGSSEVSQMKIWRKRKHKPNGFKVCFYSRIFCKWMKMAKKLVMFLLTSLLVVCLKLGSTIIHSQGQTRGAKLRKWKIVLAHPTIQRKTFFLLAHLENCSFSFLLRPFKSNDWPFARTLLKLLKGGLQIA